MKCLSSVSSIPPPSESQGLLVPSSHARRLFAAVGCPLHCGRHYPHPWVMRYYPDNDKPSLTTSFHHTPRITEPTAPCKGGGSLSACAGIGRITFSGSCIHSSWYPLDQSGHPSTACIWDASRPFDPEGHEHAKSRIAPRRTREWTSRLFPLSDT